METQSNNKKGNLIIAIVMTGAFISSLRQTLLSTALPNIMSDFKITADVGQWLTTIYLLIAGIIVPTTAYLINRFSTRKLFITSMYYSRICSSNRSNFIRMVSRFIWLA